MFLWTGFQQMVVEFDERSQTSFEIKSVRRRIQTEVVQIKDILIYLEPAVLADP